MYMTSVEERMSEMPRVSTTDLVRQIGHFIDESLRSDGVIVQRYGRDVAVLVDIKKWEHLMSLVGNGDHESDYQFSFWDSQP